MDINVSSRNVEVSPSLRAATEDKVGRLGRYLEGMDLAEAHFSAERNPRIENKEICELTLLGQGHHVRAKAAAPEQFAALDLAIEKLEQQLAKLKSRLVARNQGKTHAANGPGTAAEEEQAEAPRVVKRKQFELRPMSVDEAILQLEMLGHAFFYFRDAESGETAVVYQRDDGNIGLIQEAP